MHSQVIYTHVCMCSRISLNFSTGAGSTIHAFNHNTLFATPIFKIPTKTNWIWTQRESVHAWFQYGSLQQTVHVSVIKLCMEEAYMTSFPLFGPGTSGTCTNSHTLCQSCIHTIYTQMPEPPWKFQLILFNLYIRFEEFIEMFIIFDYK